MADESFRFHRKKLPIRRQETLPAKFGCREAEFSTKMSDFTCDPVERSISFTQECLFLQSVNGIHKCEVGFFGNQEKLDEKKRCALKIEVIDDTALIDTAVLSGFEKDLLGFDDKNGSKKDLKQEMDGKKKKGSKRCLNKGFNHMVEDRNAGGKRGDKEFLSTQMGKKCLRKCASEKDFNKMVENRNVGEKRGDKKKFLNAHHGENRNEIEKRGGGFERVCLRKDKEGLKLATADEQKKKKNKKRNRKRTDHKLSKNCARTNGNQEEEKNAVCGLKNCTETNGKEKDFTTSLQIGENQDGYYPRKEITEANEKDLIVSEKTVSDENCPKIDTNGLKFPVSDENVHEKKVAVSKKVYSKKEMGTLRFVGMEKQRKKWAEIYCGLAPAVAREYNGLLVSNIPLKNNRKAILSMPPIFPLCPSNYMFFA